MCVVTALAIGGAVAGAAGTLTSGIAASQAASYQAQVARNNAIISRQNAAYSASAGAAQTEAQGMKESARLAEVRAGAAANGLDVNTGSVADLQEGQRRIGQLDTETVANNAALKTYGYETQSVNSEAQAKIDDRESGFDLAGGILGAAGKLGSAAGSIGGIGGGSGGAGGDSLSDIASESSIAPSQLSGDPSVGEDYQWMTNNSLTGI